MFDIAQLDLQIKLRGILDSRKGIVIQYLELKNKPERILIGFYMICFPAAI